MAPHAVPSGTYPHPSRAFPLIGMSAPSRIETGRNGEDIAADYLEKNGYRILDRNYRFEGAEVDIICFEPNERYEHGGELAFVEVKTRRNQAYGSPEEAVSDVKQEKVAKASEAWLHERRMDGSPCRFDVIAITISPRGEPRIEHFKDAFAGPGSFGFFLR